MEKAKFGMIGLGTMGRNFLLNVAEHGFSCVGYDLDAEKRSLLLKEGAGLPIDAAANVTEFVDKLAVPRNIMLLVPAGKVVDIVIDELLPHLVEGDLIIDGGNSHFTDTERREVYLSDKKIEFMGVGVSGGEEGARHGCAIMPGGNKEFYERVAPILEAVSAKVNGDPCVAYMGASSAGHFVKMVHNGIEYGLMQLIAETYDLMHRGFGMNDADAADLFGKWNASDLNSFLIEITETVLKKTDDLTKKPLVEMILDTAGQKGTGKWTSQVALDMGVPIPTIDSAVTMRQISSMKMQRTELAAQVLDQRLQVKGLSPETLESALFGAFIITYAQGLSLLSVASTEKSYGLNLAEIAKIWRGGCIIRAGLLEQFRKVYSRNSNLDNILFDPEILPEISSHVEALRKVVAVSAENGFVSYCLASCLAYFDGLSTARLPANLIQAQRDYFGAHTYSRIDQEGTFHTSDWDK